MLTFGVDCRNGITFIIKFGLAIHHFDFVIAANVTTLLFDCRWNDIHVNMWSCLIEMDFEAYYIFFPEFLAYEFIYVESPFFDTSVSCCSFYIPVFPLVRITLKVHLLIPKGNLLHLICASGKDKFNIGVLLICGTRLVLLEADILQNI